jgi:hypothetical protein
MRNRAISALIFRVYNFILRPQQGQSHPGTSRANIQSRATRNVPLILGNAPITRSEKKVRQPVDVDRDIIVVFTEQKQLSLFLGWKWSGFHLTRPQPPVCTPPAVACYRYIKTNCSR